MSDEKLHLPLLPNGKPHISFSELATWLECPWKHKLAYIDGLSSFDGNEHTEFGTAVHSGCEDFLMTREMKIDPVVQQISDVWDKREFDDKDKWIQQASAILSELPQWMDETFLEWESLAAEQQLYESLDHLGHPDANWKGFVDAAISHKNSRGKQIIRIIDWKTTAWGWRRDKLRDFKTNAQAAAYKIFWSRKYDVDMKDIRAAFVLLKREGKPGGRCQMIEVSVGAKTEERVNASIDKMLKSMKRGYAPKNRMSCRYCEFKETEHCPSSGQF